MLQSKVEQNLQLILRFSFVTQQCLQTVCPEDSPLARLLYPPYVYTRFHRIHAKGVCKQLRVNAVAFFCLPCLKINVFFVLLLIQHNPTTSEQNETKSMTNRRKHRPKISIGNNTVFGCVTLCCYVVLRCAQRDEIACP